MVSNLKRLCTEFVEGLSQEDEGSRNIYIERSIAVQFQDLLGVHGCEEFGGDTSMPGSFCDVIKAAADAHIINKYVKIISLEQYLVLNVVVRGTAGGDKKLSAGVDSNSGPTYQELCKI